MLPKVNEFFLENPMSPIAHEKMESTAKKIIYYVHKIAVENNNERALNKPFPYWLLNTNVTQTYKRDSSPSSNFKNTARYSKSSNNSNSPNIQNDKSSNNLKDSKNSSNDKETTFKSSANKQE
jgi:hypothetical protein